MTRKVKQQIKYTLAAQAVEKLIPSKEALRLCEQMANGTVNADTAVSSILERYGLARVRTNG